MNFSEALIALKEGKKLQRENWNGKGMYIKAQFPETGSKMRKPYIYIVPCNDSLIPWVASHADLFGEDWVILN